MKNTKAYTITVNALKSRNQPVEMTLADLIDELDEAGAISEDTAWQMRLAIMHTDLSSTSPQDRID